MNARILAAVAVLIVPSACGGTPGQPSEERAATLSVTPTFEPGPAQRPEELDLDGRLDGRPARWR